MDRSWKKADAGKYRGLSIYSIFPRNFSKAGDLQGILPDLPRIRAMGFDAIWLLPIHPIGEIRRKGTLGSPYSIADYFAVDPSLGTLEDFRTLVREAHAAGLLVIMDVVFHHTSWDSVLMKEHPDWFYHGPDGTIGNKVGDWYDIADLDHEQPALWDYLQGVLEFWCQQGADGFRCDVAPMIPLEFWRDSRQHLDEQGHRVLWLSESIEPDFIMDLRSRGFTAHSDGEMYQAFDLLYDYDVYPDLKSYYSGGLELNSLMADYMRQQWILPKDHVKLRFLENHDQIRAGALIPERRRLLNATALAMFLPGAWLFYNGQETMTCHRPDLFNRDPIRWQIDPEMAELQTRLNEIRQSEVMKKGSFHLISREGEIIHAVCSLKGTSWHGWFSVGAEEAFLTELPENDEILFVPEKIQPDKKIRLPLIYSTQTEEDAE